MMIDKLKPGSEFEFEMKFKLPDPKEDPAKYLPALEAFCSDAVIGTGRKGYIAFDFVREAKSIDDAVFRAINEIQFVIKRAELFELKITKGK